MPFNTGVWVDDQEDVITIHIDESEITPLGASMLQSALNEYVHHRTRRAHGQPNLRIQAG